MNTSKLLFFDVIITIDNSMKQIQFCKTRVLKQLIQMSHVLLAPTKSDTQYRGMFSDHQTFFFKILGTTNAFIHNMHIHTNVYKYANCVVWQGNRPHLLLKYSKARYLSCFSLSNALSHFFVLRINVIIVDVVALFCIVIVC